MNIKNEILNYIKKDNQFVKAQELKKILNVKGEQQTELFYDALNALVEEGSLFFDNKKGYKLFTNDLGFAYGEIEINKAGNGFIHTKDGYTIFIANEHLNGALNGDLVMVSSIDFGRRDEFKGEVHKVLKRKTGNVIFEVVGNGYAASLIPYNINENIAVNINKNELKNLVDGEMVLVKVSAEKEYGEFQATIQEVIGHKNSPGVDIKLIFAKYGVPVDFSKETLKEANELPTEVTEKDIVDKKDMRDKEFITMDCDDTKDRDDAIYAEKLSNGNIKLYVAISLIDYYVKRGSKIYNEALIRCTSHYDGGTCTPLFPPKLSNGICSLNENVDRLVRIVEMEVNPEGKIIDYDIYSAVINSRKQMTYSEVNRVLNNEKIVEYEKYLEQLQLHEKLCGYFEKARKRRRCIDYELHDIEKKLDTNGKTEAFVTRGDGIAERIIENEMLAAGTTIAEHFSWLPFMYRIQESPDPKKLKDIIKTLRLSGFDIPKYNNVSEETINNILSKIRNKEEADIIRTMLLRGTKRAKYSTINVGHFALQLKKYCHFTAPIRRVIDFMIHTLISELETFDYSEENIERVEQEFNEICERASEAERIAQLIEAETLAMDMAEYMESHIGEGYDGIITEVYPHGMFVKLNNNITGKIKFENMHGDKFRYDYDKRAIIGTATKKKYQIGKKVFVVAKDACKATRTINFEIGKQKSLRKDS